MRGVTSQDNLTVYFTQKRPRIDEVAISELNKKIKSIKAALKLAQKHNEELQIKIKHLKDTHQYELIHLQAECHKYKQLYAVMAQNYEHRNIEVKQYKKKIKRLQIEHLKNNNWEQIEIMDEQNRQFKDAIMRQSKDLLKLKEENRLLYDKVDQRNNKIRELENVISKNQAASSRTDFKDRSMLNNLKQAMQANNGQLQKTIYEKQKLLSIKQELQQQNHNLLINHTKVSTELEYEKKANKELNQKVIKQQKDIDRLSQQNRSINQKYSELLTFSLDLQKDFQKQLYNIAKELQRDEIIKIN